MTQHPVLAPLIGGALIGVAAAAMLLFNGRIAGISGIVGGVIDGDRSPWRFAFVAGLFIGGAGLMQVVPFVFASPAGHSLPVVAAAGLLVGFGTRLGGGCTSGHGVCGMGRLSKRSVTATLAFMFTGAATASAFHVFGANL